MHLPFDPSTVFTNQNASKISSMQGKWELIQSYARVEVNFVHDTLLIQLVFKRECKFWLTFLVFDCAIDIDLNSCSLSLNGGVNARIGDIPFLILPMPASVKEKD